MYIPRAIEDTVRSVSKTFPVLLLTGPRQVGKTTLLQKMAKAERGYVTLDDPDARYLAKSDPALFLQRYAPPVIIDEIQYAPELLPYHQNQCGQEPKKRRLLADGLADVPHDERGLPSRWRAGWASSICLRSPTPRSQKRSPNRLPRMRNACYRGSRLPRRWICKQSISVSSGVVCRHCMSRMRRTAIASLHHTCNHIWSVISGI